VRVTPAKLEHDYKLSRDGMVIADAHSILACVDRDGRVRRISDVVPELTEMQPDRQDPPPS
jgi:acyl-CoA thioester hydrolase